MKIDHDTKNFILAGVKLTEILFIEYQLRILEDSGHDSGYIYTPRSIMYIKNGLIRSGRTCTKTDYDETKRKILVGWYNAGLINDVEYIAL